MRSVTAWAAVASPRAALRLLSLARQRCGPTLTAFELVSDVALSLVEKHFASSRSPFETRHPQAVLLEVSDHEDEAHARAMLEGLLADAIGDDVVIDAVVADASRARRALWSLRENISEAQAAEGKNIKHDVSVPISRIADFIESTDARARGRVARHPHGHVRPPRRRQPALQRVAAGRHARREPSSQHEPVVRRIVHDAVAAHGGSISAEHGIGQLKRDELVALQERRRARADAGDQGRDRPARDHESGEGVVSAPHGRATCGAGRLRATVDACRPAMRVGARLLIGRLDHRLCAAIALFAGLSAMPMPALATSYRCDVDGRVTYSDKPCTAGSQSTVATDDPVDAADRAAALERRRQDQATLAQYARDRQKERQQDLQAAALAKKRRSDIVKDAQGCRTLARRARNAHDAYDIAGPRDQPKARMKMEHADEDYAALCRTPRG